MRWLLLVMLSTVVMAQDLVRLDSGPLQAGTIHRWSLPEIREPAVMRFHQGERVWSRKLFPVPGGQELRERFYLSWGSSLAITFDLGPATTLG